MGYDGATLSWSPQPSPQPSPTAAAAAAPPPQPPAPAPPAAAPGGQAQPQAPLFDAEAAALGRALMANFLRATRTYDILPESCKVVVFDVAVPVKLAFYALVEHGACVARGSAVRPPPLHTAPPPCVGRRAVGC